MWGMSDDNDNEEEGRRKREKSALVAPFHEACVMALCSSPAAWMPFMRTPHMPSWPTTSYRGDRRTKNSSVAFAVFECNVSEEQGGEEEEGGRTH